MTERNGVRLGQRVRDVDGRDLGSVKALYDWGFAISKGFPILFRRDWVARYDEVRGVREGALVLARSDRDLFQLAEGDVPDAWRIPTPPAYPALATPSEALGVFEEIAAGAISTEPEAWPAVPVQPPAPPEPPHPADTTPASSLSPATRGRGKG
jgi:hypothetical protein